MIKKKQHVLFRIKRVFFFIRRLFLKQFGYYVCNDRYWINNKGKYKGNRCFIIGNGPSLQISDLSKLNELNEYTFAFNKIFLSFNECNFRPSFYILEDRLVLLNIKEEIKKLSGFTKFFPYDYKGILVDDESFFFYMENRLKSQIKTPLFNPSPWKIGIGESVTYSALQLATYLGFNPIYLMGVDFSFKLPSNIKVVSGQEVKGEGEVNHFHPDYRPQNEKWYAPDLDFQKKAFEQAKKYADQNNIKIYNATRGGKLEVFERANLDDVLSKKS